jgi:shikimate dehydrogenase
MHNAAFRALGLPYLYLKFRVPAGELREALERARLLGFRGLNLTIPLKQEALKLVDILTPEARKIGAVNTVTFGKNGMEGHNTDGEGFIRSLRAELGFAPAGRRAVVIGAGGASRAVTHALADAGVKSLVILDRDARRSAMLARDLRRTTGLRVEGLVSDAGTRWNDLVAGAGLLVNASPVGMHGSACPLPPAALGRGLAVADLVYNPPVTPLMREARRRGLRTMNGSGMLVLQGALAFERWTGRRAPVKVMRKALLSALGGDR